MAAQEAQKAAIEQALGIEVDRTGEEDEDEEEEEEDEDDQTAGRFSLPRPSGCVVPCEADGLWSG